MALDFGPEANAALASSTVRRAVLFRVDSNPVIRAWGAVGDFPLETDLIETGEGAIYAGIGMLIALPVLKQLINGRADRVEFGITGKVVTANLVDQAMIEAGDVEFCRLNIGIVVLGADWQPISRAVWLWEGEAGPVSGERTGGALEPEHKISLSVGSAFAARRRARIVNFTNAHQQRLSPGDLFCERVGLYASGSTRKWP